MGMSWQLIMIIAFVVIGILSVLIILGCCKVAAEADRLAGYDGEVTTMAKSKGKKGGKRGGHGGC